MCTMECYSVVKKTQCAEKLIDLENILSDPDSERQTLHALVYMWILTFNDCIYVDKSAYI